MNEQLKDPLLKAAREIAAAPQVIFSGMGTSGNVARLLAGTFNSIGKPAVFLHPCDALHGDFGVFGVGDVLLIVSASGETPELIFLYDLFSHYRELLGPMILIGNPESTLGRQACFSLDTGPLVWNPSQYGFPFLPINSTEMAVCQGHVLVLTLARLTGLTEEKFRRTHPANAPGLTSERRRIIYEAMDQVKKEDSVQPAKRKGKS